LHQTRPSKPIVQRSSSDQRGYQQQTVHQGPVYKKKAAIGNDQLATQPQPTGTDAASPKLTMNQEAIEWIMGAALTAICFVVLPAFGLILSYLKGGIDGNTTEISNLKTTVAGLSERVEWIKEGVRKIGDKMGDILHSPHTPEFDALIEAYWHGTITEEQVTDLQERLNLIISEKSEETATPGQKALLESQKIASATMLGALHILHPKKGDTEHVTNPGTPAQ
jgi:hypothetical protein